MNRYRQYFDSMHEIQNFVTFSLCVSRIRLLIIDSLVFAFSAFLRVCYCLQVFPVQFEFHLRKLYFTSSRLEVLCKTTVPESIGLNVQFYQKKLAHVFSFEYSFIVEYIFCEQFHIDSFNLTYAPLMCKIYPYLLVRHQFF